MPSHPPACLSSRGEGGNARYVNDHSPRFLYYQIRQTHLATIPLGKLGHYIAKSGKCEKFDSIAAEAARTVPGRENGEAAAPSLFSYRLELILKSF